MSSARAAAAAAAVTVVAVVAVAVTLTVDRGSVLRDVATPRLLPAAEAPAAPELVGISHFDNTEPLTLKELRGRVVLVDFWTYTCINCRRTFPFLRALHSTYPGLTVLGVHSPEFGFEKEHANVARAVQDLGVTWPVAEDPQMATWSAFANQYWPAKYLLDRQGRIRYTHVGEGDEKEVEDAVRALLAEGGTVPSARAGAQGKDAGSPELTRETYFGTARADGSLRFAGPVRRDPEYAELGAGGSVTQRFSARDVYATTAPAGGPVVLDVTLDGVPVPAVRRGPSLTVRAGRTVAVLEHDDLLHLLTGPALAPGTLQITARSAGARFFTFTYGA